jgi:hypothetical protein
MPSTTVNLAPKPWLAKKDFTHTFRGEISINLKSLARSRFFTFNGCLGFSGEHFFPGISFPDDNCQTVLSASI